MIVKFTYCRSFGEAETKETTWDDFAAGMSRSIGFESKEASINRASIVGGVRDDEVRGRSDNITTRTIAALDYDNMPAGATLDDIEMAMRIDLDGYAYVAHTTFRHTPEAPRFRVYVPLSRTVSADEYGDVINSIRNTIGLGKVDKCSYSVNQIMFLPSHKHGSSPWMLSAAGKAWIVPDAEADVIVSGASDEEADDLLMVVASKPLDISEDRVRLLLDAYPAEGKEYDEWVRVGMAIYHQTEGSDEGYEIWMAWSEQSSKHDARQMRTKWRSFGGTTNPVTMATIIHLTGGGGSGGEAVAEADSPVTMSLEDEAEAVSDRDSYAALKTRVKALGEAQLPPDIRSMIAARAHEVWAKDAGMGLREVKKAFQPTKAARPASDEREEGLAAPDWLDGWCYGEKDCVFINTVGGYYDIKREAFKAKYDRMPEVVMAETDAATYALNMVKIPTVARGMYWPGQPTQFSFEGRDHVNTYHVSGCEVADEIDEDGQVVVDDFVQHVRNTIEDEREGDLLIDFLAFVYANPGKRVQWAFLLWGIEGNGKTYFYRLMEKLMGRNARSATTSMIERPFTDWAINVQLIGIEEIRISGVNKWAILDKLKPLISNPTITVEPKGLTSYHAPNFASYFMTTNHQDAVPASDNDRRYCVVFSKHRTKKELISSHGGEDALRDYFDNLFSGMERRPDAIARFFLNREYSADFHPQGRAPTTGGMDEMRGANVSEDRMIIDEAIEDHACEVVSDSLIDVTHLNKLALMDGVDMPVKRALANVMRDKGYVQIDKRRSKIKGDDHFIWFKRSAMSSDEAVKAVKAFHTSECPF